jgi:glc operon protein GlcG
MRTKTCLTLEDANAVMLAAKAAAKAQGWAVSIVVVDEAGLPLHLERLDGASFLSVDIATQKARTAVLLRRPTQEIEEMVKARPGFMSIPGIIAVQGGLPILAEGACVGGVGVSGVQSHQDEDVARAGIAALGHG